MVRISRSLDIDVILGHACHAATSRTHTADVDTRSSGVGARLCDRVVNHSLQPAGLLRCDVQADYDRRTYRGEKRCVPGRAPDGALRRRICIPILRRAERLLPPETVPAADTVMANDFRCRRSS